MGIKSTETRPPASAYTDLAAADRLVLEQSAAVAIDKATTGATGLLRSTVRARGLGRLSNAVGSTSSFKGGRTEGAKAWGVLFARGGDDSLAGGALEAYSQGAKISPVKGPYVWFQTKALKSRVGLNRMTPARYISSGSPLGKLQFRRKDERIAELFVKGVTLSAKSGRARIPGGRSKAKRQMVVLFVGLKNTTRLKRFDKDETVGVFADKVSDEIITELTRRRRR